MDEIQVFLPILLCSRTHSISAETIAAWIGPSPKIRSTYGYKGIIVVRIIILRFDFIRYNSNQFQPQVYSKVRNFPSSTHFSSQRKPN